MKLLLHPTRLLLIAGFTAALIVSGCGGDDDDSSSTSTDSTPATTASESGPGSSEGESLTEEEMLELAGTDVEGYVRQEPRAGFGTVTVGYDAEDGGSGLAAVVTLSPCDPFICWDLDGEITEEHEENLLSNLSRVHIDNPDLVFEYGTIEIAPGYEAFYTYSRSFIAEGGSKSAANAYRIIYHDGANLISIQITPEFGPLPDTEEELEMQMDMAGGEMAARNVFAAYANAFQPVN